MKFKIGDKVKTNHPVTGVVGETFTVSEVIHGRTAYFLTPTFVLWRSCEQFWELANKQEATTHPLTTIFK